MNEIKSTKLFLKLLSEFSRCDMVKANRVPPPQTGQPPPLESPIGTYVSQEMVLCKKCKL